MLLVEGWENDGLLFSYDEALKIIGWNEKYRKSDGEEKAFVGTIDSVQLSVQERNTT